MRGLCSMWKDVKGSFVEGASDGSNTVIKGWDGIYVSKKRG